MSKTTDMVQDDWASWIREHQVCWELAPNQEMVQGKGVQQTGYAFKLFGRVDSAAEGGAEAVARGVYERLRALVAEATRSMPAGTLVQMGPPGRAVLPPESPLAVEAELTVVATFAHADRERPASEARELVAALEERLRSIGLRKRG
jgi:hypothetical protein